MSMNQDSVRNPLTSNVHDGSRELLRENSRTMKKSEERGGEERGGEDDPLLCRNGLA